MNHIYRKFIFSIILFFCLYAGWSQPASGGAFREPDSLYMAQDFVHAKIIYKRLLSEDSKDAFHLNRLGFSAFNTGDWSEAEKFFTLSLATHPSGPIKASVLSRMARIGALRHRDQQAMDLIDSAVSSGYSSLTELDTLKDFDAIRVQTQFKKARDRVFNALYPCANDPRAKEFDFWVGEWEVYVTGSNNYAGHSLVQKISGGCGLLENWTSSVSEGKSLNFIDDSSGRWKQVWVGSYANGKQDFFNGEYKEGAMRFTYETKDLQGNRQIGRFIFYNQGTEQVRQFNEFSPDNGKTWTTSYDFTYKRKK